MFFHLNMWVLLLKFNFHITRDCCYILISLCHSLFKNKQKSSRFECVTPFSCSTFLHTPQSVHFKSVQWMKLENNLWKVTAIASGCAFVVVCQQILRCCQCDTHTYTRARKYLRITLFHYLSIAFYYTAIVFSLICRLSSQYWLSFFVHFQRPSKLSFFFQFIHFIWIQNWSKSNFEYDLALVKLDFRAADWINFVNFFPHRYQFITTNNNQVFESWTHSERGNKKMASVRLFRAANLLTKTQLCFQKQNPAGKFCNTSVDILSFSRSIKSILFVSEVPSLDWRESRVQLCL